MSEAAELNRVTGGEPAYDLPYTDGKIKVGDHVVMRNIKGAYGEVLLWWRGRHGKVVWRADGRTQFVDQNGFTVGCQNSDVKKVDGKRLKQS